MALKIGYGAPDIGSPISSPDVLTNDLNDLDDNGTVGELFLHVFTNIYELLIQTFDGSCLKYFGLAWQCTTIVMLLLVYCEFIFFHYMKMGKAFESVSAGNEWIVTELLTSLSDVPYFSFFLYMLEKKHLYLMLYASDIY